MKLFEFKVSDIKWCVDYEEDLQYLPTETIVKALDEDEIADALSDKYGFLVESFSVD